VPIFEFGGTPLCRIFFKKGTSCLRLNFEEKYMKSAIVTGAARGIGAAIARRLAANGFAVVVNFKTGHEAAEAVAAMIRADGNVAKVFQADVSREAEASALVTFTLERFGRLDVLVNNAGLAKGAPLEEIDEAHIAELTSINIGGLLLVTKHAAARLGAGGGIINVSSVNATSPVPGGSLYSATKAAVNAITVGLARELGSRGIRVNAVAPGLTMTERYDAELTAEVKELVTKETPLGRLGVPEDIAEVVAFLASDAARWITGEVITVSGGAV
jgi:3-oxoacyl-[acyl-carrier protein] reductase